MCNPILHGVEVMQGFMRGTDVKGAITLGIVLVALAGFALGLGIGFIVWYP